MDKLLIVWDWIVHAWSWLLLNYDRFFTLLGGTILMGEAITRFTPTRKDDGFVKRLGNVIDRFFDMLHIPNIHTDDFKKKLKGQKEDVKDSGKF